MLRPSTLLLALLLSSPVLWQALVQGSAGVDTALLRFLVAIPVSAVLLGLVRLAARRGDQPSAPVDAPAER